MTDHPTAPVQDDDIAREIERWKGEVYLDLNERRNPGKDEFATGWNGGIIEARDLIYSKLPQLRSRLSPTGLVEALKSARPYVLDVASGNGTAAEAVVADATLNAIDAALSNDLPARSK